MLVPQGFRATVGEITENLVTVTQCGTTCIGKLSEQSKILIQSLNDLKQGSTNKIRRLILRLSEYQNSRLKPIEDKIAENLLASGKSKEIVEVFRKYKLIIRRKQEQRSLDRDAARADDLSDVFTGLSVSGGRKSRRHVRKERLTKPASIINITIKLTRRHIKRIRRRNTTRKPHKARKAHRTRSSPRKVGRRGHH